jgi:hypothetical protein
MADALFELRLDGGGMHPDKVPLRELLEILSGVEDGLFALAKEQNPTLKMEEFYASLVGIVDASAGLKFASTLPLVALAAWQTLGLAIDTSTFVDLPPKALEGISRIVKVTQKLGADAKFYGSRKEPIAVIRSADPPDVWEKRFLQGETVLYGSLLRVGGDSPSVRLRLEDGSLITCQCKRNFAKILAHSLYDVVGIKGRAWWHPSSLKLVRFIAVEVLNFQDTDIVSAFDSLRDVVNGDYDDVEDVVALVEEIRG